MRRGEVLGLQWIDVDLDGGSLSVLHTLVSVDYKVESSEPKTPRARRTIDLDTATAVVLREHRKSQLEQRMMMGAGYGEAGLVFARADGSVIHPQALSDRFDRLVSGSGLPRIRLHDLRHTHATMALKAGVPVKVLSERLGHASVAFTMDVYQHVLPGMQREAAELVAGLIFESQ